MSVSISVAVSASNAAALGIGLAQDLYRLAVENPSVECQIGRVAQAFVDLNLTLGDLASALVQLQASSLSLSPLCSDLIEAVFSRIHGVQKTFWARLTDDVSSIDKLDDGSGASIAKHSVVTTKLGRLKMLFPGSAATELLTEMEWMRNTLAVLAATCRLSMTHQASQQIVSETLTSALLIYIRQIEQKLADIDDEVDDPSDDDEPITGPGSLFFSVAFTSTAKPARKRGVSPTFEKNLAASKLDAATWIYEALRDMASKSDPTEGLPSRFVEWLLGELTVAKVDVALDEDKIEPASEIVEQPTNSDNSESFPSLFSSPVLVPAATCISKEADDMAAEVTESITVVSVKHQVQQVTEGDNKSSVEVPVFTETTGVVQSINTTNHISESHLPTTESAATPKLGKEIKAGSQQMPDGPNENEITYAAKIDVQKFYDDLPPPYPYPESYATHHREPHFGIPGSFYPPVNGMSHPPPASLPGDFSNTICMQPQPAFSPANFYPLYSPYMAAQPYNDRGQASNLGFDANFNNDYHYSHPSTIGLGPGMRTFPAAPPFDPRGRPAPYSPAPSVLGKFNGSKDLDATMTTRRHHGPQSSRQNNSQNSRKIDDDRETEPAFSNVQEENYKTGVEISSESRFERAKCFPTEHRNTPTYLQNKTGKSRAVAHVSKKDDNYSDEEDNFSHFSKTRTIDTRKRAFNTRGIRNSKDDAEEQPTEKHCNNSSSHYTGTFPPPLSSPDVVTGIDYQILRSKSLSKSTSEAGAMISAAKTEGTDKSKMRPVSDKEEITDDDDDGSEYESASENISNGKTQLSDADRSNARENIVTDSPRSALACVKNEGSYGHAGGSVKAPYSRKAQSKRFPLRMSQDALSEKNASQRDPETTAYVSEKLDRIDHGFHQYPVYNSPIPGPALPSISRSPRPSAEFVPWHGQHHGFHGRGVQDEEYDQRHRYDHVENDEYCDDEPADYQAQNQHHYDQGHAYHNNGIEYGEVNHRQSHLFTPSPFPRHLSRRPRNQYEQSQHHGLHSQLQQQPPLRQRQQLDATQPAGGELLRTGKCSTNDMHCWIRQQRDQDAYCPATEQPWHRPFTEDSFEPSWSEGVDRQALQQQAQQTTHMPPLLFNTVPVQASGWRKNGHQDRTYAVADMGGERWLDDQRL